MINLQEFQKDEIIIKEYDIDEYLYLIESGKVQVFREKNNLELTLAYLDKGAFFGEMALIDERPRSASIRAIEKTIVKVFHRKDFLKIIHEDQSLAIKFLGGIFSRLREANSKLIKNYDEKKDLKSLKLEDIYKSESCELIIEGLNLKSSNALPENPCRIILNNSTFNVGRISSDPFSNTHLAILDSKPMQISRNHFSLQIENNKIAIYDIGSSLGLKLNNIQIGGSSGSNGPLYLDQIDNIIVIGGSKSDFKYKISKINKSNT